MRTLIAEHWGLSAGGGWVVVNGLPGEMNFGKLVATGFRDEQEALEFIRQIEEINTSGHGALIACPNAWRPELRIIQGGRK